MENADISVIIPVYNAEKYIFQCIQSVINQTKKNIEIIVVNDGSTDNSLSIIEELASTQNNIRIICQENKGLKEARITGYKNAKGKYIGWLDADDFVKPEMYERLYTLAEEKEVEIVYCDYEFYPSEVPYKVKWFRPYTGEKNWEYLDKNTQFWNKLFLRDLLDRVDLIKLLELYGEYSPILPMLEAKGVYSTQEQLMYYRVGHVSMSGGKYIGKVKKYQRGVAVTERLKNMIQESDYASELDTYFDYRYIYTLLLLCVVSARNSDKEVYIDTVNKLRAVHYKKNPFLSIVSKNYGGVKAFIMISVVPSNYTIGKIVTKLTM